MSTSLRGDFTAAHYTGDQSDVLPTDSQKQTCYAYAKEKGIGEIETYGLDLARHFVDDVEPVTGARIEVEEYGWDRVDDHDHTWVRRGGEIRRTVVTVDGVGRRPSSTWVVSGFRDLVLLKSTGSQFWGFHDDPYTVLQPTTDRVMSTSLVAWWRYVTPDADFGAVVRRRQAADAAGHTPRSSRSPCSRRSTRWERLRCKRIRRSPRCGCRPRTSITSSTTCRRSGWRTTTRCSTPTTGRTG